MKNLITAVFGCLILISVKAQNEIDALRFSERYYFGSARFMGVGGAFGALGGDFGGLSINPAGIGIYRSSEFSFTPSIRASNTNATFMNNLERGPQAGLNVASCGIINVANTNDPTSNRLNFGFGYNRLADFNQNVRISGMNSGSSLADVFVSTANGTPQNLLSDTYRFGAGLAWIAYLIDPFDPLTDGEYVSAVPSGSMLEQTKTIERSGSMGETFLTFGSHVLENFYWGMHIGFPTIRYTERSVHREDLQDPSTELEYFTYKENLTTNGNGINLKLGGIYRVNDWLRVGLAYHSRDFMGMRLTYSTQIKTSFRDGQVIFADSPTGLNEYRLRTPGRFVASAAFLMGKQGFVSADYEFVNYGRANLLSRSFLMGAQDYSSQNLAISELYRGTHNVRVGSEVKLNDFFAARAGVNLMQNPFSSPEDRLRSFAAGYSLGGGFRVSGMYVDLAYTFSQRSSVHYLYNPQIVDVTMMEHNTTVIALTVGFKY